MDETTTSLEEGGRKPSEGKKRAGCTLGLIIPLLTLLPLWFFFLGPKLRHDRLLEKGVKASGRLLSVDETGTVVNDSPELELIIEFTRSDGTLDTASTDFVPSRRSLHFFQPGVAVTAAYDPEDPEDITVVDLSTGTPGFTAAPAPAMPQASQHLLDSLRRAADSLQQELARKTR